MDLLNINLILKLDPVQAIWHIYVISGRSVITALDLKKARQMVGFFVYCTLQLELTINYIS